MPLLRRFFNWKNI